jgi:hypothetical protein
MNENRPEILSVLKNERRTIKNIYNAVEIIDNKNVSINEFIL